MDNIYIVGAGFSRPAGLPLGDELFEKILTASKETGYYEGVLKSDIDKFLKYKNNQNNYFLENDINFEEFISFLDIEHYLQLSGSNTWSDDGNKSQLIVRNLISKVILEFEMKIKPTEFEIYKQFADILKPSDYVLTFNYDTLLERALFEIQKPFRLFPIRFESIDQRGGIGKLDEKEVIVLKMHGSINWFSREPFESIQNAMFDSKYFNRPSHLIFENYQYYKPQKIIDNPYIPDSKLQKIYAVYENLEDYFSHKSYTLQAPLIISPSFSKLPYLNPFLDFWRGINSFGGYSSEIGIIGFSLPNHDEYIRVPLNAIINNFNNPRWNTVKKESLKVVDYKNSDEKQKAFKENYNFLDSSKTEFFFDGFSSEAIKFLIQK